PVAFAKSGNPWPRGGVRRRGWPRGRWRPGGGGSARGGGRDFLMFGLVTRRELRELEERWKKKREELEYEWADWYGRFRTLHARLAKPAKEADRAPAEDGADGSGQVHPAMHRRSQAELARVVRGNRGLLQPSESEPGCLLPRRLLPRGSVQPVRLYR